MSSGKSGSEKKRKYNPDGSPVASTVPMEDDQNSQENDTASSIAFDPKNPFASLFLAVNSLHDKLDIVKVEQQNLRRETFGAEGLEPRLGLVEAQADDNTSEISEIKAKCAALKEENDFMKGTMVRQNEKIEVLEEKLEQLTARSMNKNLIFSGIEETEDSTRVQLDNFISEKLSMSVPDFQSVHRMGEPNVKTIRPIVAECFSLRDRNKILENAKNLKDVKNSKDKPYFISVQLPEGMNERKKNAFFKIRENAKKSTDNQVQMKYSGGRLFINGQLDRPTIVPPTPEDIFLMDSGEKQKMEKIKLVMGKSQSEKGSTFYGVAAKVQSVQDVRRAYKYVRFNDPSATHIIAAYKLGGQDGTSDHCDDGEHGGGIRIKNVIDDDKRCGVCVFVVRHYGGQHLGYRRFEHISASAKSALSMLYK